MKMLQTVSEKGEETFPPSLILVLADHLLQVISISLIKHSAVNNIYCYVYNKYLFGTLMKPWT